MSLNKLSPKVVTIIIVVIIVAGLIGLIILSWLRGDPRRSKDYYIVNSMDRLRTEAEIIYEERNKSYEDFSCTYNDMTKYLCNTIEKNAGAKPTILASSDKYCAYVKLIEEGYFCIDSSLKTFYTDINPGSPGHCDGKTFVCPSSPNQ